jgi:hypothetical protein
MIRRYREGTIEGGPFTRRELQAAQAVGAINAVGDDADNLTAYFQRKAPLGWYVQLGVETSDDHDLAELEFAPNAIHLGWAMIQQRRFPYWLCEL